jgi:hypothetical protein
VRVSRRCGAPHFRAGSTGKRTLERRLDVLALALTLAGNGRIVDIAVLVDLERERLSVAGRLLAPELERVLGDRTLGVGPAVAKVSLGRGAEGRPMAVGRGRGRRQRRRRGRGGRSGRRRRRRRGGRLVRGRRVARRRQEAAKGVETDKGQASASNLSDTAAALSSSMSGHVRCESGHGEGRGLQQRGVGVVRGGGGRGPSGLLAPAGSPVSTSARPAQARARRRATAHPDRPTTTLRQHARTHPASRQPAIQTSLTYILASPLSAD